MKLASELQKRSTGRTVYVLDEPTTGLHFEDIRKLLLVLESLVDKGNTVIVIEHNLDVIKTSDWVIDMGPEGGNKGGTIIATGTPEELSEVAESYTGEYLRRVLGEDTAPARRSGTGTTAAKKAAPTKAAPAKKAAGTKAAAKKATPAARAAPATKAPPRKRSTTR